jgi:hypothetical protein
MPNFLFSFHGRFPGRPTVSYNGGALGFVRVDGPGALTFPWYDGNGMFYSAGNLSETCKVGLLFIDFVTLNRLRVQGEARIVREASLLSAYPGAQFLVRVEVESLWVNCPRYIHRYQKIDDFKYLLPTEVNRRSPLGSESTSFKRRFP